jgi:hypothetical protein
LKGGPILAAIAAIMAPFFTATDTGGDIHIACLFRPRENNP